MNYKGIVLTGTSGCGKTTIAKKLCELSPEFEKCKLITTRSPRCGGDDEYQFISVDNFLQMRENNSLFTDTIYRGDHYGISKDTLRDIIEVRRKIPILTISPESQKVLSETFQNKNYDFLSFFIDAQDSKLDERLIQRDGSLDREETTQPDYLVQRAKDREFSQHGIYSFTNNGNIDDIVQLIFELWQYRYSGGLLSKKIISLMINCGSLLSDASVDRIQGASYDLVLGEQFAQNGIIEHLSDTRAYIVLKPGDYAIVTSKESANLPKDIAARYDLTVGLFAQGVILSNGPQVDPGFKGSLFCLLFNASNQEISIRMNTHFVTIEFIKLLEPTISYSGEHQNQGQIHQYIPRNPGFGEIVKLRGEIDNLNDFNLKYSKAPIIISVISLIVMIIIAVIQLWPKGSS